VVEVNRRPGRKLHDLGSEGRGREVLRNVREVLQGVRKRALHEEALHVTARARRPPERFRRARVAREHDARAALLEDVADGRNDMRHRNGGRDEAADRERLADGDGAKRHRGHEIVRQAREVGPQRVVEKVFPEGGEDVLRSHDLQGRRVPAEDVLDQERERRDMVHVRVRDEDGADAGLFVQRQRVGEGAGVDTDRPVHEEGRLTMRRRGAAMGSEDADAHGGRIMSPRAAGRSSSDFPHRRRKSRASPGSSFRRSPRRRTWSASRTATSGNPTASPSPRSTGGRGSRR